MATSVASTGAATSGQEPAAAAAGGAAAAATVPPASASSYALRVFLRVRPTLPKESVDDNVLVIQPPSADGLQTVSVLPHDKKHEARQERRGAQAFTFDGIFGPGASQAEVFSRAVEPQVMACLQGLTQPPSHWTAKGVPLTCMLAMERRKGKDKPVIRKALVELGGRPFGALVARRAVVGLAPLDQHPRPQQAVDLALGKAPHLGYRRIAQIGPVVVLWGAMTSDEGKERE